MATLLDRAIGAATLDPVTYEGIESDESALGQAMVVVAVASIASGIGSAGAAGGHGARLVGGVIGGLVGWFVWAVTIWLVGTRLLPERDTQADLGQVLRTTGFAAAPGVVGILGVLPLVGGLALFVSWLWQIAAMVVAVRQALDYSTTGRAALVCIVGAIAQVIVLFVVLGLFVGSLAALFGGHAGTIPG